MFCVQLRVDSLKVLAAKQDLKAIDDVTLQSHVVSWGVGKQRSLSSKRFSDHGNLFSKSAEHARLR